MTGTPSSRAGRDRRRAFVALLGVAAVIVAVAIALSASGGDKTAAGTGAAASADVAGRAEVGEMLAGVPQDGITLGRRDAPVTLVEFVDPQCPFCRQYSLESLPRLVQDYVRTGRVRMQLQVLTFIGDDSLRAGRVIAAAAAQNRMWNVADLMYFNQGAENSGYVTEAWLRGVLGAVPGLNAARALRGDASATARLADAQRLAERHGVSGTPSFLVGRTGGPLRRVALETLGADELAKRLDAALGTAGR